MFGGELDRLAKELASGEVSRRVALKRLGQAALVTALAIPKVTLAGESSKRCPHDRRCNGKCCPKHAKCKRGKCKCVSGYTKCGRKCVDLQTSASHCGSCDNACASGEFCVSGHCVACRSAADCPTSGVECKHSACGPDGTCIEVNDEGTPCGPGSTWACSGGTCQCSGTVCGDQNLCVDTNSDSANCGTCGHACSAPDTCISSACLTACTTDGDCSGSIHGHHCLTTYGICGCRPGTPIDCSNALTCVQLNGDANNGMCL